MNPCGRIVDVLRSCYAADFRFWHDSPKLLRCEWCFVPDDRPLIPFAHAFGSRLYERDDGDEPAIGERYEPHPWRGGSCGCADPVGGLCGSPKQWLEGTSIKEPLPATHPGTSVPKCCQLPVIVACGGEAYGRPGFGRCHMESTFDLYKPFGAANPTATNISCQFVEDLLNGRGTSPNNTVAWTHYIDFATSVNVQDGCDRTAALNTINYNDGDEVRIPTGGAARYVVVWVTLCDKEGTVVKRAYLMRHLAG